MFVCLELDTEDIAIKQQIDSKLSAELGFTHIVWGVNSEKNNAPEACKLPSTLFYTDANCSTNELDNQIIRIVNKFNVGFLLLSFIDSKWTHRDGHKIKAPQSAVPSGNIEEIENRQE